MHVLLLKAWKIIAVIKRKDSNCFGILSDPGKAATASNLSEYTIQHSPQLNRRRGLPLNVCYEQCMYDFLMFVSMSYPRFRHCQKAK